MTLKLGLLQASTLKSGIACHRHDVRPISDKLVADLCQSWSTPGSWCRSMTSWRMRPSEKRCACEYFEAKLADTKNMTSTINVFLALVTVVCHYRPSSSKCIKLTEQQNIAKGRTDPEIDSVTQVTKYKIQSLLGCKFGHQPDGATCIVPNWSTRWRHLHQLQKLSAR